MSDYALQTWLSIIQGAKSEEDRMNWVKLTMQDHYITTKQIIFVLDFLDESSSDVMKLDRKDLLIRVWSRILDSENKFSFLKGILGEKSSGGGIWESEDHKELAKIIGFTRFKFNYMNPTGHWHLELSKESDREVWQIMVDLHSAEVSTAKSNAKGYGDTSQKGNWTNFRNERKNNVPCVFNEDVLSSAPMEGVFEFDYVSTTRPRPDAVAMSAHDFTEWCDQVGINTEMSKPGGIIFQMQLLHALCAGYFTVEQAFFVIDGVDSEKDKEDTAVQLFSRVIDLENFNLVIKMKSLQKSTSEQIVSRLGWLNIGNPLMPEQRYDLNCVPDDNRVLLKSLMDLSVKEDGQHFKDAWNTEMFIWQFFENRQRVEREEYPVNAKFEYLDMQKGYRRSNFTARLAEINKFLIGRHVTKNVLEIVHQYEELEKKAQLTSGTVKDQYARFLNGKTKRMSDVF
jgi:hypothetical protein